MPDPGAVAAPTPVHRALGLSDDEYQRILDVLAREPTDAELAMFSVMWSEHCSYKSSRRHLGRFPSEAPWVVVGPGEGAGVVDIGDGWLAALRIESHNHPSFVEPYQGAATGVGGIVRDVFSVGARPIALWNQIRFGPLDDPHNRYLFNGVVAGIAGYGNAVGVPTVGGEIEVADCYTGNPLVNVMCLGLLRREDLVLARTGDEGNAAVLLGAATGRDGIGGASILASTGFAAGDEAKRPSVQVGDPFEEKKLIEACLELYRAGLVEGIQDLGAAGISCAASEIADASGMGLDLQLDEVHRREEAMSAPEVLMSESQERMLAVVRPQRLDDVLRVAAKWEVDAAVIGTVRPGGRLRVYDRGDLVADAPVAALATDTPVYDRPSRRPDYLERAWAAAPDTARTPDVPEALLSLLDTPGIADPSWIYEQYDHMLFLNTVVGPGNDGALLRVKGTAKGLAVSTDGGGRRCHLDPRRGAARLVFESALNVAVTGARPLAMVDNLNFGNPERPEVMWQFTETVAGMAEACEALGIPVVGGNVSFYNETDGEDIYPTPVVGLLGLADPMPPEPIRIDRARAGLELWEFGPTEEADFAASAYADAILDDHAGRPAAPDPDAARAAITAARVLAASGAAPVLHDISDGGLAVAVAEICIKSGIGATVAVDDWTELFGEAPHRFVAAVVPGLRAAITLPADAALPARRLGHFGGDLIDFGSFGSVPVGTAAQAWRGGYRSRMG